MIFDTHIHLNDDKLLENIDQYISEAKEKGITKFLCIGFDLDSSKKAIELALKYEEVYASIGVIPTEYEQYITRECSQSEPTIEQIRKLAKLTDKIVAIGEIGLDYYWEKEPHIKEKQKIMFKEQIELANELDLPISIHARDAIQDVYDILKENPVKNTGIMHCYSGSLEMAKEFIKLGYLIAFGGVLTFKNSKETKNIIKNISLENIVFETDAPYLAPTPYRGKLNEPKYIFETVKYAAELLEINQEELEKIAYANSIKILHVEK